jgi:hypothetical protein
MLYTTLPLLRGWMYVFKEFEGALQLGVEQKLDEFVAPGFVLFLSGLVNGSRDAKFVTMRLEIDGPEKAFRIDTSPHELRVFGLTSPTNFPAFLTIFDDTAKTYAAHVAPSIPIPFTRKFLLKLVPPEKPIEEPQPIPIRFSVAMALVKIVDEEEFRRSFLELLGLPRILRGGGA